MVYLITHGERQSIQDPGHTEHGFKQIERLSNHLPSGISLIVVGAGRRFQQILEMVKPKLKNIKVQISPFCGSPDSITLDGKILSGCGVIIDQENYIGIVESDAFDAWKFISELPDHTLLCAGGELMTALYLGEINEKGHLYELDPEARSGKKIQ